MKTLLKKIKSFFTRKPKEQSAVDEPPTQPKVNRKQKADRFMLVSWLVTLVLVIGLLGSTLYYKSTLPPVVMTVAPATEASSGSIQPNGAEPIVSEAGSGFFQSIFRKLQLKTNIPERARDESDIYRVSRGDTMYKITEKYKITINTVLFANPQLDDNPQSLRPGMELIVPPVDGLYYTWKEGDTFETVADKFDAVIQDIIDFSGNQIDLTNLSVEAETKIFIPGGSRELRNWSADLQTTSRGTNTGTGSGNATNACGGGPVASGFGWPTDNRAISGTGYEPSHLGLDITAPQGANIYASGSGIVTMAQGGWNYGYGNVIQIDHGNGYITVYAHLSQILVSPCEAVGQGAVIGLSGDTGNSFGAHLHFEVRVGGANINPYEIVQ
jgi:murein DD-endopeptidase MepM/ murein hydrolase activator NlpD